MVHRQKVLEAIFAAVDTLNCQLQSDQRLEKSNREVLFGENGRLDSLGLINFLVAVEQEIEDQFKRTITLFDESLITSENSPLSTIGELADYVTNQLKSS